MQLARAVLLARPRRPNRLGQIPTLLVIAFCSQQGIAQPDPPTSATINAAQDGDAPPQKQPGIVPPRLLHFVQAKYPTLAEQQGLEATVLLHITVNSEGRVTRVEVKQPAGDGFDEAATAAAEQFVFEPATRNGTAVGAKIPYRFQFKREPRQHPQRSEDQVVAPRAGELRGKIVAGSPPAPIAGVSLRLAASGQQAIRLVTLPDGSWRAAELAPGDYTIEIEASGYRRVAQPERVLDGQVTSVTYILIPSDEMPIEVTVRGAGIEREVTHYEIPRTELLRVPGTMGDAIHSVEAMPSVARPRGLSGDLIIRGSAPEDSLVQIEGTPIPQVFHYGGLSSVIPGELLERIEYYPSNFSVRYGRALGGLIELRMRQTNPDGKYHGSAQVDLVNARAHAEGPVPGLHLWRFMGGLRASYFDRWLAPIMRDGATSDDGLPRYYDYQAYLERRLSGNGVYRIGVLGAYDTFVPILRNSPDWRVPRQDTFIHLQSQLRLPVSSAVDFKASWSLGRNSSRTSDEGRTSDKRYIVGTMRSELSFKTGSVGIARLGTDLQYGPFSVKAHTDPQGSSGDLASQYIESPQLATYDIRGVYLRPACYAEYEFAPDRRIDVTAGLRLDYARDTRDLDLAPRLAVRYVLVEQPLRTVLKGGIGLFYQPPSPDQTLSQLGTPGLSSSNAVHSMLGIEQALAKQVTLSVEGFEKELSGLLSTREDGTGHTDTENSGRGRVWGADFLLRVHSSERFFGWLAYTLSRSTRWPSPDQPEELYRYDQTHVLNLLGSYKLGRGWELGSRFRYATGPIYESCTGGLYDSPTGTYRCYGPVTQKRLAAYHQLDVRLEKTWHLQGATLSAYLDVFNFYNYHSPDKAVAKYDYSATKPLSRSLPLLPSIGLRGEI